MAKSNSTRIIKIFADKTARRALADSVRMIEPYDAFIVGEASAAAAKVIAKTYPVEDITDRYTLSVGQSLIKTARPGIGAQAAAPKSVGPKLSSGPHHYLVQFVGPVKMSWVRAVRKTGAETRVPHSEFTYIVRATAAQLKKVAALPFVRWIGHLAHKDRVAAGLLDAKEAPKPLPRTRIIKNTFVIEFFGTKDMRSGIPKLRGLGFEITDTAPAAATVTVSIDAPASKQRQRLRDAAAIHGVQLIRRRSLRRSCNNVAVGIMGVAAAWGSTASSGLQGEGETIAICDTGLDTGTKSTIHEDFRGRVKSISSFPITSDWDDDIHNPGADDGAADRDEGHGTHVAGSVLGNGAACATAGITPVIRGSAPKAKLVFQAVEQEMQWKDPADEEEYGRFVLAGIPADITELLRPAYNAGARIHSNSWGGGEAGEYDDQCRQLDQFVWDKPKMCVLVAAGNDGEDRDRDGRINPTSITSPCTAKNCITVGASENLRPAFNAQHYGGPLWWPGDYPVAPFHDDPMANDEDQVVAFSSRGPTSDGRIKPDLIAPGTFILSTRSTRIKASQNGWAAFQQSRKYFYMGGTSMATPLVAGAAALTREFLRKRRGIASPSAALIKASLIVGCTRLPGGAAGGVADNDQGFGRVNLEAIVNPAAPLKSSFHDQTTGINTGTQKSRTFRITTAGKPLKICLCYSDYPGDQLVNNLNLMVQSPAGAISVGNSSGGMLTLDSTNNVEMVRINSANAGDWIIRVVASSVPHGPQRYALAVIGAGTWV